MCQSLGWGWEQARRELNIPRLKALNAYWKRNPPVHLLVKGFTGYKGGASETPAPSLQTPPASDTGALMDSLINDDDG